MENLKRFDEYRREYSLSETSETRKTELLLLMRENLEQRCSKDHDYIMCLNEKEYSIDSANVSELYAIDSALKNAKSKVRNNALTKKIREEALLQNKYNPNNPYSGK